MPALRPLPPQPNLEFEKKEAKALLRRLRVGDAESIARARARHPGVKASDPARIRLADAQLVIAREYGFTSWPKLVRYFGDAHRQSLNQGSVQYRPRGFFDGSVRGLLAGHRDRQAIAARQLAAYVPRFYGMRLDDVFASSVAEDDARLAVARHNGYPSWEVLLARCETDARREVGDWEVHPAVYASKAMESGDLEGLECVVQAHPELLHPTDYEVAKGGSLLRTAIHFERLRGRKAMRPIMAWLAMQGLDHQGELNRQLCGHIHMKTEKVRWLLQRGADPNWVAPNGIPVLEHALIRYWNGEAVDLVAARATPRKALWISAGLGDVDGVRRSIDAHGRPRPAARRLRPDFDAVDFRAFARHPEPDDEEILMEAFLIAMLNGRTAVLEYMVSRGFPVDSLVYGSPAINFAVGNCMTAVVECLVRCGADLDLQGWHPQQSAREMARELFEFGPEQANRRHVVELCGMDPDAILAERDASPIEPPSVDPKLREALELAADDAFRLGQSDIQIENLLFGLLRSGGPPLMYFAKVSRMDLDSFREDVRDRVRSVEDRADHPPLPLHPDAQAAMRTALGIATERRRETVQGLHLLYALTSVRDGAAAELLARYGSSAAVLNARLEGSL
jgi:Clp amino terminal domain, pathogenicity island component